MFVRVHFLPEMEAGLAGELYEAMFVLMFTHGQHGRGQQPPGEELQEDHHHRMSHFGPAPAVLRREREAENINYSSVGIKFTSCANLINFHSC